MSNLTSHPRKMNCFEFETELQSLRLLAADKTQLLLNSLPHANTSADTDNTDALQM